MVDALALIHATEKPDQTLFAVFPSCSSCPSWLPAL